MKITEHIPGYIDIDGDPFENQFTNTEELLNIDWVISETTIDGFSHFSYDEEHLIAEYNDGEFIVVGHLEGVTELDLPKFIMH